MFLGIFYTKSGIILATYCVGEYIIIYKNMINFGFIIIPMSLFFLYREEKVFEYIMINTLVILLLYSIKKSDNRTSYLSEEWEKNRVMVSDISNKLQGFERYKEQEVVALKLQERNELSGKMHDKIGHTLAGALLQLEALKIILKEYSDEKVLSMLSNIINVIRHGMDDIRMTLREVKPSNEELGINKIKLLLEDKIKNTEFTYTLLINGNTDVIDFLQWTTIIEGVRELSTNSIKYSRGKKISVIVSVINKLIKIEVKDDGVGNSRIKKGMGLGNLEERLMSLGGNLILDGSFGFSAIMILPVKGD